MFNIIGTFSPTRFRSNHDSRVRQVSSNVYDKDGEKKAKQKNYFINFTKRHIPFQYKIVTISISVYPAVVWSLISRIGGYWKSYWRNDVLLFSTCVIELYTRIPSKIPPLKHTDTILYIGRPCQYRYVAKKIYR